MAWVLADAVASLRRRLSDGVTDKFVHQMDVDPTPNGLHRVFAVPHSLLVPDTLTVFLEGEPLESLIDLDEVAGTFEIEPPDEGQKLFASYYYQWFTDAELEEFLQQAAQLLNFTGVVDDSLPVGLRTAVQSFAAYYAYMKKAANSAPAMVASSSGFTSDTSKEHPYWMDMAKMAWDAAQQEVETFNENPVSAVRPALRFVAYRMARYVPRT